MTRTIQEVRAERDHHLSIPENRLNYVFAYLRDHGFNSDDDGAELIRANCYSLLEEIFEQLDTSEAHY